MMVHKEKAIERVRKILAVARETTYAGEAQQALLRAQELLMRHGLSESEVELLAETEDMQAVTHVTVDELGKKVDWRGRLASTIAENFRCTCYYSRPRAERRIRLRFVGLESDAAIAAEVYKSAIEAITHLAKRYLEERRQALSRAPGIGDAMQSRSSFIGGFLLGLHDQFKEQIAKNSWALALIQDEKVQAEVDGLNLQEARKSSASYSGDPFAREAGYEAGRRFDVRPTGGETFLAAEGGVSQ